MDDENDEIRPYTLDDFFTAVEEWCAWINEGLAYAEKQLAVEVGHEDYWRHCIEGDRRGLSFAALILENKPAVRWHLENGYFDHARRGQSLLDLLYHLLTLTPSRAESGRVGRHPDVPDCGSISAVLRYVVDTRLYGRPHVRIFY